MVKHSNLLLCAVAACTAFFACTKAELKEDQTTEQTGSERTGRSVSIFVDVDDADESRAALSGKSFSWSAGDAIAVIDDNTGTAYRFETAAGGTDNVCFTCDDVPEGANLFWAVYPYVDNTNIYAVTNPACTTGVTYDSSKNTGRNKFIRFEIPTSQTGRLEDLPHRFACNWNQSEKWQFRPVAAYWKFSVPESLKVKRITLHHDMHAARSNAAATTSRHLAGGAQIRLTGFNNADGVYTNEVVNVFAMSNNNVLAPYSDEIVVEQGGSIISGDVYIALNEMNSDSLDVSMLLETQDGKVAFLKKKNMAAIKGGQLLDGGTLSGTLYNTETISFNMSSWTLSPGFTGASISVADRRAYAYTGKDMFFMGNEADAGFYTFILHPTYYVGYNGLAKFRLRSIADMPVYLEFPTVEGKRLVKVDAEFGPTNSTSDTNPHSGNAAIYNDNNTILKDAYGNDLGTKVSSATAASASWDLYGRPGSAFRATAPGDAIRIAPTVDNADMNLKSLTLTYVGNDVDAPHSVYPQIAKVYHDQVAFLSYVKGGNYTPTTLNTGFEYKLAADALNENAAWLTSAASGIDGSQQVTSAGVSTTSYYDTPFLPVLVRPYAVIGGSTRKYGHERLFNRFLLNLTKASSLYGLHSVTDLAAGAADEQTFTVTDSFNSESYACTLRVENLGTATATNALTVTEGTSITFDDNCTVEFVLPGMKDQTPLRLAVLSGDGSRYPAPSEFCEQFTTNVGKSDEKINTLHKKFTNANQGSNPCLPDGSWTFPTYKSTAVYTTSKGRFCADPNAKASVVFNRTFGSDNVHTAAGGRTAATAVNGHTYTCELKYLAVLYE